MTPLVAASRRDESLPGGCRWVELKRITYEEYGSLTPVEALEDVPFEIKRVFYLYDVPVGTERGFHAHRELHEVIVVVAGSIDITLDDGRRRATVTCNSPTRGLHLVPGVWIEQRNFAPGTVGLVFASEHFDEADYIRDYAAFRRAALGA
jgi:hypothetical protein